MAVHDETDPTGKSGSEPGSKLDSGKAPLMQGVLHYFPRAILAVAQVSELGAKKYTWKGWLSVPDGENRYGDAMARHVAKEIIEGPYDQDPKMAGTLHAAQVCWNALARLELILERMELEAAEKAK